MGWGACGRGAAAGGGGGMVMAGWGGGWGAGNVSGRARWTDRIDGKGGGGPLRSSRASY